MNAVTKALYVTWLRTIGWGWFCTLTVRYSPGRNSWHLEFARWIRFLEDIGNQELSWACVAESGRSGFGALRLYVLVAGAARRDIDRAQHEWSRLGGTAEIDIYESACGGLRYMLKSLEQDQGFSMGVKILPRPTPQHEPESESEINPMQRFFGGK